MKKKWIVYHVIIFVLSLAMCLSLGIQSYQGTGNERATWALATVSGMFGAFVVMYASNLIVVGFNKLKAK